MAVPVGEASRQFHGMIRLNETGAFVWNLLTEKDLTEEALVEALLSKYDVDPSVAKADVARVVATLNTHGILV